MRTVILLLVGLAVSLRGFAQMQTPTFQIPLWFEDALGNRDTLIIGYDVSASAQLINSQFGEIEITTPFDSVFEVRAVHADDNSWKTTKVLIEDAEQFPNIACHVSGSTRLMLHAKYPPIKISWDTAQLNSSFCHNNTILTPDRLIEVLPEWWNARIFYCMANTNMVETALNFAEMYPPDDFYLEHPFEVEGQGLQTLPGFYLVFRYDWYCQTVSVGEAAGVAPVRLIPNPASAEEAFLFLPDGYTATGIAIVDALGRSVRSLCGNFAGEVPLELTGIQPGIYSIVISGKHAPTRVTKLVRM